MTNLYVHHDFKAVGQGLFAFGKVNLQAIPKGRRQTTAPGRRPDWKFSWVYDCGTSSAQALVERGVKEIAAKHEGKLDLVTISHLHWDHISGLLYLLNEVGARTIMFPWAPLWQRLQLGFEQGLRSDDPAIGFYLDPVGFLAGAASDGAFNQVIFVMPSNGGTPPDPNEPNGGFDPTGDHDPRDESKVSTQPPSASDLPKKLEIPDSIENQIFAKEMPSGGRVLRDGSWEFVPYNDPDSAPNSVGNLRRSVKELSDVLLGHDVDARAGALASLQKLYRMEFPAGLQNDLSLSLYCGPVPLHRYIPQPKVINGEVHLNKSYFPLLYTGDGNFSTKTSWRRICKYLGEKRTNAVSTFQVPHHGSKHNLFRGSGVAISPRHSVFSSDPTGRYGHPDPEIWRDFLSFGPRQVDKHSPFRWDERLQMIGK